MTSSSKRINLLDTFCWFLNSEARLSCQHEPRARLPFAVPYLYMKQVEKREVDLRLELAVCEY